MRRMVLMAIAAGFLALPFIFTPAKVQISYTDNTNRVYVNKVENTAEAKKRRSSGGSFFKKRSYKKKKSVIKKKKSSVTKKKPCSTTSNCSASGSKGKLDTKQLFKKGDKKGKATTDKARNDSKKKSVTKSTNTKAKPVAKVGSKSRPAISKSKTKTVTASRKKSISAPKAKKTRIAANKKRSNKTLYSRTRAQSRSMRSSRSYWRNDRQYYRNARWSSYDDYGWGYGYRPGWTYHAGWGGYGYGYTRGGLSVVDYMILSSIFGRSNTSNGDTVINNTYVINGEESEVTAVPEGSRLTGFGNKKSLIIPSAEGNEVIEIPVGSTYAQLDEGMLITTPDGVAVLVPSSTESYKAEKDYKIPEEASEPMVYDKLQKN